MISIEDYIDKIDRWLSLFQPFSSRREQKHLGVQVGRNQTR